MQYIKQYTYKERGSRKRRREKRKKVAESQQCRRKNCGLQGGRTALEDLSVKSGIAWPLKNLLLSQSHLLGKGLRGKVVLTSKNAASDK